MSRLLFSIIIYCVFKSSSLSDSIEAFGITLSVLALLDSVPGFCVIFLSTYWTT